MDLEKIFYPYKLHLWWNPTRDYDKVIICNNVYVQAYNGCLEIVKKTHNWMRNDILRCMKYEKHFKDNIINIVMLIKCDNLSLIHI